ncbi:MAG: hypothetical protein Q8R91_10990 [Candidatus Omnitrophota bacterium]|nr:hypothetical protein [Candidatus Omnitrophota bacterium]
MTPSEGPPDRPHEAQETLRERFHLDAIHADYLVKQRVALHDIRALSLEDTIALRREWERIYIPPHEKRVHLHWCPFCKRGDIGRRVGGERIYASSFNWHTFSYGLFPNVQIDDSDLLDERKQFLDSLEIKEPALVLMWEPCGYRALEVPTTIAKQLVFDDDCYLFPRSLAWTFVATHEPWSFYAKRTGLPA